MQPGPLANLSDIISGSGLATHVDPNGAARIGHSQAGAKTGGDMSLNAPASGVTGSGQQYTERSRLGGSVSD